MDQPLRIKLTHHWCPKLGCQIKIDTKRSKSCLECKFKVHRLVYVRPLFVQYVLLAYTFSAVFLIYNLLMQNNYMLFIAIAVFCMNVLFYYLSKLLVSKRKLDVEIAKTQELKNYAMRKI